MEANALPERLKGVMRRFAAGVTVITSMNADGGPAGMTATAFTSVSIDPPMVLVCANAESRTSAAIAEHGSFAVNLLAADDRPLAELFASRAADKFAEIDWTLEDPGVPVLAAALASVRCRVARTVQAGTHLVYIGEVVGADSTDGEPLIYLDGDYRQASALDRDRSGPPASDDR
ncbi:MAG: flavin reductase family protein [Actinomycetota bacterium]